MMKCRDIAFLLSESQDRSLSLSEGLQLRLHLFMCKKCTHFSHQLKVIRLASQAQKDDRT
ncbi:zf-HC2 domain-containing protein [Deefgea sp. CFH1-16]|uniref:zf-HC2 domain-containing protein n=1 Tax=Deefgea sp. CFH1-16 TaxID=2675457 RepID=UPI0015F52882|nr:zf-HC2 domain-containing protein [Deefgea sp. CFH1-16]